MQIWLRANPTTLKPNAPTQNQHDCDVLSPKHPHPFHSNRSRPQIRQISSITHDDGRCSPSSRCRMAWTQQHNGFMENVKLHLINGMLPRGSRVLEVPMDMMTERSHYDLLSENCRYIWIISKFNNIKYITYSDFQATTSLQRKSITSRLENEQRSQSRKASIVCDSVNFDSASVQMAYLMEYANCGAIISPLLAPKNSYKEPSSPSPSSPLLPSSLRVAISLRCVHKFDVSLKKHRFKNIQLDAMGV